MRHIKIPKLMRCRYPLWAWGSHAQTILGHLLPSETVKAQGVRHEISLEGGDKLVSHYYGGKSDGVVYLFHGLGGTSPSSYINRSVNVMRGLGHHVFVTDHRGCGKGEGLAVGPYHSGRAEDLSSVIEFGRNLFPDKKHLAIGFSLSGNALLLLLSGERGKVKPDYAVAEGRRCPKMVWACEPHAQRG